MAIPDYESIMLPLLKEVSDNKEHTFRTLVENLAKKFNLTDIERKELLPSGRQSIFDNRVGWASTYMKKAGLLESPRRAVLKITPRGETVLQENPTSINTQFLNRFPEFIEFKVPKSNLSNTDTTPIDTEINSTQQTPEETLELSYQKIRTSLAEELLTKVINLSPAFFERLVVELLVKMGYGGSIKDAGRAIGKSGDEGIDGTIKEDNLGLDIIYIQAKRWKPGNIIGRPEIHKFVGALAGQGAKKGIFITTSSFTKDAIEYVPKNETKIVLIDGQRLSQLMIDYNIGVNIEQIYELKRIDNDYFDDE